MKKKATVRNYMEFIRELSNARGTISISSLAGKNGITKTVGVSMKEQGYISCTRGGRGSRWCGPAIHDEAQLREIAEVVMRTALSRQKGYMDKFRPIPPKEQTYTHKVDLSMADISKEARDFLRIMRPVDRRSTFRTKLEGDQLVLLPPRERKKDTVKPVQKVGLIRRFINWIY